jgi:hypothetical protein
VSLCLREVLLLLQRFKVVVAGSRRPHRPPCAAHAASPVD